MEEGDHKPRDAGSFYMLEMARKKILPQSLQKECRQRALKTYAACLAYLLHLLAEWLLTWESHSNSLSLLGLNRNGMMPYQGGSKGSIPFQTHYPLLLLHRPVSGMHQGFCRKSRFNIALWTHDPPLLKPSKGSPSYSQNLKTSPVLRALMTQYDSISSQTALLSTLPLADFAPASGHLHLLFSLSRIIFPPTHMAFYLNSFRSSFQCSLPSEAFPSTPTSNGSTPTKHSSFPSSVLVSSISFTF